MKISQREARRMRAQLKARERADQQFRNGWLKEWPDGVHLATLSKGDIVGEDDIAVMRTARRLERPVFVIDSSDALHFYGVK